MRPTLAIVLLVVLGILVLVVAPGLTMGRSMTGSALAGLGLAVGILAVSCVITAAFIALLYAAGGS